jgi:hypothetical protein
MNTVLPTPVEVAQRYLQAWNETDPQRRGRLVREVFADGARYVDPLADVAGHEGIDALIAGMQKQFDGARFVLKGDPQAHHDQVRFSWTLALQGNTLAEGTDVAVVAGDQRLANVTGFLDYLAPGLS